MKSFALTTLILGLLIAVALPQFTDATPPNADPPNDSQPATNDGDQYPPKSSASEPHTNSVFPNTLDISSLHNMPLIILHPRTPINFQMMPGEDIESIRKSLSPSKILELIQAATGVVPAKSLPPNPHQGENREARNRNLNQRQPQPSTNRPVSSHSESHSHIPALPRSVMNPNSNNGWFQRFRGSFSNMFPMMKPSKDNPFHLGLPSFNLPVFIPQQGMMHGTISPFSLGSFQQFQNLPWRQMNFHTPSIVPHGDLSADASHMAPLRMMFGNPHLNHFRPGPFSHHSFGGDLATSGSAFVPTRILPPAHHGFPRFVPPVQRHKPLFNNVDGLHAASMEISNAFADFTDSKEHGPEVTQKFGAVGHSINNFLKMMGLGSGLSFGDVGGFGGGADMAGLDSTPIARSMDFYPGYGNQAHMDDFENLDSIEDFPIFHEDITEEFMKKMNLTNSTAFDEIKKDKEVLKKDITSAKTSAESTQKIKVPIIKTPKDKSINNKPSGDKDISYASAVPLEKNQGKKETPEKHVEIPVVNYKIPQFHSTVAPYDRKQPIAIYQHFKSSNQDAPKPPTYAPAQPMETKQEGEDNPNKLVDEDEVRQWRSVNSGQGYVEKRPVPIVDILQSPMHPESLKVLQKVLADNNKTITSS